jgi:preprotein translocase subunit SecE
MEPVTIIMMVVMMSIFFGGFSYMIFKVLLKDKNTEE